MVTGCTTQLAATKVSNSTEPVVGQVYNLARIDYSVTLDRELKACSVRYASDGEAALEWLRQVTSEITTQNFDSAFKKIKDDPILQKADVIAYLDYKLGAGWADSHSRTRQEPKALIKWIERTVPTKASPKLCIEVEMRARAVSIVLPDAKHVYAIQYQGMQEITKGTNYAVETYPNGTLKSINVTLDDQTGSIIQNTIQGVAKIAAASGGFPLSLVEAPAPRMLAVQISSFADWLESIESTHWLCNARTRGKLLQRVALDAAAESDANKALEAAVATSKLEKAHADARAVQEDKKKKHADLPDGDPGKPALAAELKRATAAAETAQKDVNESKKNQQAAMEASAEAAARLDALRKQLTATKAMLFRPEQGDVNQNSIALEGLAEAKALWLDKNKTDAYCLDQQDSCDNGWPAEAASKLKAQAAIYPGFAELSKTPIPASGNIVYRQPVKAMLFVCKESCLDQGKLAVREENILLSSAVDVPQFGVLAILPLKNTAFQNNTIGASFSESGALTKLTYTTNATAAKAAEVFANSADTFLQYKNAKRKEETAKLENSTTEVEARTKLLQAQLEQEKAQADLDKFRATQKTGD